MTGVHQSLAAQGTAKPRIISVTTAAQDQDDPSIVLPTGIINGDLLVHIFAIESTAALTTPSGYTQLVDSTFGGNTRQKVIYRVCDGTENLAVVQTLIAGSLVLSNVTTVFHIRGQIGTPEFSTAAAGGASTTLTPAGIAPSWGSSSNSLIISAMFHARAAGLTSVSSWHADYTIRAQQGIDLTGAAVSSRRGTFSGTETPGTLTLAAAPTQSGGHTIAIRG